VNAVVHAPVPKGYETERRSEGELGIGYNVAL